MDKILKRHTVSQCLRPGKSVHMCLSKTDRAGVVNAILCMTVSNRNNFRYTMTDSPDKQRCHCEVLSNSLNDTTSLTAGSNTQRQPKSAANIHQLYRLPASVTFFVAPCSTDVVSARQQSVAESHYRPTPAALSGNCSAVTWGSAVTENDIGWQQSVIQVSDSVGRRHTQPIE